MWLILLVSSAISQQWKKFAIQKGLAYMKSEQCSIKKFLQEISE